MDKYDIDFFLSFQFLGDAQLFEEFYNDYAFIQGNQDQSSDCKNDTIDIIKTSIREYILGHKLSKVGLLFSGGIDSFIILHYLREEFPDIMIYTFTLHSKQVTHEWNNMISQLEKVYKIRHQDFIFPNTIESIVDILTKHYKSGYELQGDEGLLYYSYLFGNISQIYPNLSCISGDGADILFGGLSLYKLSLFERDTLHRKYFSSIHEEQYFEEKRLRFEQDFFYKYGEYFGGGFLGDGWDDVRRDFFLYYEKFRDIPGTELRKQIIFNICFWVSHRQKFVFESANNYDCIVFAPFLERKTISKILSLGISDKNLIDNSRTKIILRNIYTDISVMHLGKDFNLISSNTIDFQSIFQESRRDILKYALYLEHKKLISKDHTTLLVYFLKHAHWYENRKRIYLLINLYCFIKSSM